VYNNFYTEWTTTILRARELELRHTMPAAAVHQVYGGTAALQFGTTELQLGTALQQRHLWMISLRRRHNAPQMLSYYK
jgi:hypothetical protein